VNIERRERYNRKNRERGNIERYNRKNREIQQRRERYNREERDIP
jgi:hypothetical protein